MSKKIIIRYLKQYDIDLDRVKHRFCFYKGGEITYHHNVSMLDLIIEEEEVHRGFEKFIAYLYKEIGDNIYNGIPMMIPNGVEGEIIEI